MTRSAPTYYLGMVNGTKNRFLNKARCRLWADQQAILYLAIGGPNDPTLDRDGASTIS